MFEINNQKNAGKLSVTSIIDGRGLLEFLKNSTNKNIPLCPTNAIDIEKGIITKECVDCGICWVKFPDIIKFENPNFNKFYSFCEKDKLFIYKWLSTVLQNKSGINIKVVGYSRDKRIPLIILKNRSLYVVKASRTIRDIDYENIDLDDMINIIRSQFSEIKLHKVIILMKEAKLSPEYMKKLKDLHLLSLRKIYMNVLKNKSDLDFQLTEARFNGISD